jgi:drug/metabolite transporter (DMT)-like permease
MVFLGEALSFRFIAAAAAVLGGIALFVRTSKPAAKTGDA